MDNHEKMREKVAEAYGLSLYKQYTTKELARFVKIDLATAKRWKLKSLIPFVSMPSGGVRFFGYMIADIIILGKEAVKWQDTQRNLIQSENGASSKEDQLSTDGNMTENAERSSALRLAQETLKKRSKG